MTEWLNDWKAGWLNDLKAGMPNDSKACYMNELKAFQCIFKDKQSCLKYSQVS